MKIAFRYTLALLLTVCCSAASSSAESVAQLRRQAQFELDHGHAHRALHFQQRADSIERVQLEKASNHALSAQELSNKNQLEKNALKVLEMQSRQQERNLWFISSISLLVLLGGIIIYLIRNDANRKKKALLQKKAESLSLKESILRNRMHKRKAQKLLLEHELTQNSERKSSFSKIIEEQNQASQQLRTLLKSYRKRIVDDKQRHRISEVSYQMAQQNQRNAQHEYFKLQSGELAPVMLQKLNQEFSHLKSNEIKLLVYILNDLTIGEIAQIYQLQPESINKRRYRLRQKLAVPTGEDFKEFILQKINAANEGR